MLVAKFQHNSTLADSEPSWGSLDHTTLPRVGFADHGEADKKSTWKYPHHWVPDCGGLDDNGVCTSGTMYLHKGGLNAAWQAAMGAHTGQRASETVISHLTTHRNALGLNEEKFVFFNHKASESELQVVFGEVYAPYLIDTDRETMSPEDIRKMAWEFLSTGKVDNIDIQHDLQKSGCKVVESFIAREDDSVFIPDAWVLGVWCPDEIWAQVKKGDLNGFSFYGTSEKYPARVLVEVTKQITGITEESEVDIIPPHQHAFIVNMDNKGTIVSGKTDTVYAHYHAIKYGTATEEELDHRHRIILE